MTRFDIVVVDDIQIRIGNVEEAAETLKLTPRCLVTNDASSYATTAVRLSAIPNDCVVILDLMLNSGGTLWQEEAANVHTLTTTIDGLSFAGDNAEIATDYGSIEIGHELLGGVSLLTQILLSGRHRRVLVIVASTRGNMAGVRELLRRLNEFSAREGLKCRFEMEINGRSIAAVPEATGILKSLADRWAYHFPDPSDDKPIAGVLTEYLVPCRLSIEDAWHHDWCATPEGLGYGSRVIGTALTDYDDNKALHMREPGRIRFHENSLSHDLRRYALRSALDRLEISATLPAEVEDFKLPVMPGIAFLLALRVLLQELSKEAPAAGVDFWCCGQVFGLTVRLQTDVLLRDDGSELAHFRGFMSKVKARPDHGEPREGLSRAIWSVGHCRVDGLRNPQRDPWLAMFIEGAGGWVAWPSFIRGGIQFGW